jgi:flagellar protein FliO/FliZ
VSADSLLDGATLTRLIAVLVLVIGLILIAGWLFKRTGAGFARAGAKFRRLAVIEARPLDPNHKLVLVSRDGVEHLLVVGSNHTVVVETGIVPPKPATPEDPIERVRFRDALAAAPSDRPVLKATDSFDEPIR